MQQNDKKEWYNKEDILKIFPIGVTTYKQRIKKLNTPQLSGYTRMISKPLEDSNLKKIQVREIHSSVLNELFDKVRLPSINNIAGVMKWVNNTTWSWFGDIIPCKTYPLEIKGKMNYLFDRLKKIDKECKIALFYSIEKNTEDDYFHCHFLIKVNSCELPKEVIIEQLELIAEQNTSKETRIYLKPYDYKNHGKNGSKYTLKDFQYGYEILK